MYHFIYLTESPSGKFYIGRHSTTNLDDGYLGSGKWIRSIKDKSKLSRRILDFADDLEGLKVLEVEYIKDYIDNPNCMNFNKSSCGFGHGDTNYRRTDEGREKAREHLLKNNPMTGKKWSPEMIEHFREKGKETATRLKAEGYTASPEARAKISAARTGRKFTEEQRKNLSERRKEEYRLGTRVNAKGMQGKKHTEESKQKLRESRAKTPKYRCEHCNMTVAPHILSRWHGDNCKIKVI